MATAVSSNDGSAANASRKAVCSGPKPYRSRSAFPILPQLNPQAGKLMSRAHAISRMRGSISATMRGVKARLTRLRMPVCCGGSLEMIERTGVDIIAAPPMTVEEKICGFLRTCVTSS